MHIVHRARFASLAAAVAAFATASCTASSEYMRPLERPPALHPPADKALVVFVRPSSFARGIAFTIIDSDGKFLGDSLASSSFSVAVAPGRHLFIAWAENSAALEATVEAGRTYFVEVAPRMGGLSARAHLLAVRPGTKSWTERSSWLRDVRFLAPDRKAGQAYLDSRGAALAERIKRGVATFDEYDAEELSTRVLHPEDGV